METGQVVFRKILRSPEESPTSSWLSDISITYFTPQCTLGTSLSYPGHAMMHCQPTKYGVVYQNGIFPSLAPWKSTHKHHVNELVVL